MPIQGTNKCVASTMALVDKIFEGDKKVSDFSNAYREKYGKRDRVDGMCVDEVPGLVPDHFYTCIISEDV